MSIHDTDHIEWDLDADGNYVERLPGNHEDEPQQETYEQRHAKDVVYAAERLRVKDEATRIVARERAGDLAKPPQPVTLTEFLDQPDPDISYRIDAVWPAGGRIVLAAANKSGKTTMLGNTIRSLVDGQHFLDRYAVTPTAGRVVLIDDELDERMLRKWLRDQGIDNTDAVSVVPLRGRVASFDLLDPDRRAEWSQQLQDLDATVVLLDCLRPVLDALGLDENRDAGRFLVNFDALLAEAGTGGEAMVVHHMGHDAERSRGDSRILDWPDANWRLLREKTEPGEQPDPSAPRYFAAYGRDVDVPESLLGYDPSTRRLTLLGGTRKDAAGEAVRPDLLTWLAANPDASGRAIEDTMKDTFGHPQKSTRSILAKLIREGAVTWEPGPRNAHLHRLRDPSATSATSATQCVNAVVNECVSASIEDAHTLTREPSAESVTRCTHGMDNGDQPDEWLGGRVRCPQCAAKQVSA